MVEVVEQEYHAATGPQAPQCLVHGAEEVGLLRVGPGKRGVLGVLRA
ncbi:hypothetical protein [Streptomyces sp. SID5471]